jgi:hypothetical protein
MVVVRVRLLVVDILLLLGESLRKVLKQEITKEQISL